MKIKVKLVKLASLVVLTVFGMSGKVALSADHVVTAVAVKFQPMFLYIEPGDTVNFEGMTGHNIETLELMSPEGFEKVNSVLGENVSIDFDSPGIIVFKCTPHWGARMGGIIVVGKPENPSDILDAYTASIDTDRSNLPAKGLLKKLRKDMEGKDLL